MNIYPTMRNKDQLDAKVQRDRSEHIEFVSVLIFCAGVLAYFLTHALIYLAHHA